MNIFISYSRHDAEIVNEIIEDCRSLGHDVWYDKELSGGQSWWNQILKNIRECELVLFVVSKKSNNSTACKREYTYAFELNKRILPIIIDEVSSNLLPPELTAIHFVDFKKRDKSALLQLVKALEALPPIQPLPTELPEPPELPISYLGSLKEQIDTSQTLSFNDQTEILFKLKSYLESNTDNEEKDVYQLLRSFNNRDDLYNKIGKEIDEILNATPAATTEPKVEVSSFAEQKTKSVSSQKPKVQQPTRQPVKPKPVPVTKQTDIMGIIGIVTGFIIPIVGFILGIVSVYQTSSNPKKYGTRVLGWIAIVISVIMGLVYLAAFDAGFY